MKTYITLDTVINRKRKKDKKETKSKVTKKDFGLTENAKIIME